jgi:hypothetical protein
MILAISILVGVVVVLVLFQFFFDSFGDFLECVRYWLTPDIVSLFRGEWAEDQWASMKLFVDCAVSIGSGLLTCFGLHKHFG